MLAFRIAEYLQTLTFPTHSNDSALLVPFTVPQQHQGNILENLWGSRPLQSLDARRKAPSLHQREEAQATLLQRPPSAEADAAADSRRVS